MFTTDYEIQTSKKKLNLVELEPGRQRLGAAESLFVTLDGKRGRLLFSIKTLQAMDMEQSWFKIAYDSTNEVIAWRIRKELGDEQLQEKGWKFCKAYSSGLFAFQVSRILETFQHFKSDKRYKLEVKKYHDKESLMDNNTYFFIEIKEFV